MSCSGIFNFGMSQPKKTEAPRSLDPNAPKHTIGDFSEFAKT